jgi:P-type Cu+ transporter
MARSTPPHACRLLELPIQGMDCTECSQHVQHALAAVPGGESVDVFLASEKAVLRLDPAQVKMEALRQAVKEAGYSIKTPDASLGSPSRALVNVTRPVLTLFGLLVGAVLLIVVAGEWLGFFERVTARVPWPGGGRWCYWQVPRFSGMCCVQPGDDKCSPTPS